ncbi:cell division protein FtsQ [Cricetibacter osteomyelitidis]|uniref:Cell division protein FtsQ n=1 Tax=Cricetibacter osteomyelitidis TaxID=1521931 RepID=A0A4R2T121_9PAST|nr:cell division protein FtsQ/DivIB [Cricetibacter osteomyelitidis]TCP95011.1 cell division protein FtsQ [Cricetibacter osteomyelitidis]
MAIIKRRPTQGIRPGIRTSERQRNFFIFIKPLILLFCACLLYYVYSNWQSWLEKLDDKPIASFALSGSPRFTKFNDIREALLKMPELKGYFGQNVDEIRKQIEQMPWVKGAVVRKIWPDKLTVWVDEYMPVAVWNDTKFVSAKGEVFKLPPDKLDITGLPLLSGPDFQSLTVLDAWNQIGKELKAKNLILKSLAVDERGSWEAGLDNGTIVKLGRGEWKSKIDRLATIYPQIEIPENKKLAYIDLRYNVGAAVGFEDK